MFERERDFEEFRFGDVENQGSILNVSKIKFFGYEHLLTMLISVAIDDNASDDDDDDKWKMSKITLFSWLCAGCPHEW